MYKFKSYLINVLLVLFLFIFFIFLGLYYSADPSEIISTNKVPNSSYTFIIRYNFSSQKILLCYHKPMQFQDTCLAQSSLQFLSSPDNNDYDVIINENNVKVVVNGDHDKTEIFDIQFTDDVTFTYLMK